MNDCINFHGNRLMDNLECNLLQSRQDYFQLLSQLVEVTSLDLKEDIVLEVNWEDGVRTMQKSGKKGQI